VEENVAVHLLEKVRTKDDPDPKALACYGLLLRNANPTPDQVWLRFATGQPVSDLTTQFLAWCCDQLTALDKRGLVLIWDNASWHKSQKVRTWIRDHNRRVKRTGQGVRLIVFFLPTKSPWLNPIEPKWVHGKRAVVEPQRTLSAAELEERVYAYYGCAPEPHLAIAEKPA
jgi:transposase